MKENVVVLRLEKDTEIRQDADFILGLQLSRLYNALNANIRMLKNAKRRKAAERRDQLERVLYHAAIISECIKTLEGNLARLKKLPSWGSEDQRIQSIREQLDDSKSFSKTILKTIRNKIIYHYDDSVIKDILTDYPLRDEIRFGECESANGSDLCFTLLDEMMIHYILKRYGEQSVEFLDRLVDVSNDLLWTLKDLIKDLIGSIMEWRYMRKKLFAKSWHITNRFAPG